MAGLILTYLLWFVVAGAIGFVIGAALHRAVFSHPLLDLDGDVQGLRIRVTEAKGHQDGA